MLKLGPVHPDPSYLELTTIQSEWVSGSLSSIRTPVWGIPYGMELDVSLLVTHVARDVAGSMEKSNRPVTRLRLGCVVVSTGGMKMW